MNRLGCCCLDAVTRRISRLLMMEDFENRYSTAGFCDSTWLT
jgi:hypothetical protein